jgi:hypothetical protein
MAQILISFQRPDSMSDSQMRAWISERARAHQPVLALGNDVREHGDGMLMRVDLQAESEAAEGQLTDLLLDMRLLGLRPSVVTAGR